MPTVAPKLTCPQMWSAPSSHVIQRGAPPAAMSPNEERPRQLCLPIWSAPSSHVTQRGAPPAAMSSNLERPQQPCHPLWSAPSRCVNGNLDSPQQVCQPWSLFSVKIQTLEARSSKLYNSNFFGT